MPACPQSRLTRPVVSNENVRRWQAEVDAPFARRETVKHRGMTQYLGTFMHGDIVGLVTRASQTGDFLRMSILDTTNGKLDESSAATRVLLPVMSALRYLHKQGIVHRNVRPEYIVEDSSGMARLGGWEFVKRADSRPTTPVGPLDYMAPEMVLVSCRPCYGAVFDAARAVDSAVTQQLRLCEVDAEPGTTTGTVIRTPWQSHCDPRGTAIATPTACRERWRGRHDKRRKRRRTGDWQSGPRNSSRQRQAWLAKRPSGGFSRASPSGDPRGPGKGHRGARRTRE